MMGMVTMEDFQTIKIKINNMYRLTVHVKGVNRVDTHAPKQFGKIKKDQTAVEQALEKRQTSSRSATKGRFKIFNTLSFYCKNMEEVNKRLSIIRSNYQIQIGDDKNKPEKYGKELYNISFVN